MKLKGRHLKIVSDIQRESQAILYSIKGINSTVLLKGRKNDWIAVYIPKETILKGMAVKIEYVLFLPCPGIFSYNLVEYP
jgi:hypothetical protein